MIKSLLVIAVLFLCVNVYGQNTFPASGNAGIGTTTPTEKLEVAGNVKATGLIIATNATAGKVLTCDANGNATWQTTPVGSNWLLGGNTVGVLKPIGTIDNFSLPFVTNSIERMRLTNDGNLLVGTNVSNDVNNRLQVSGAASITRNLSVGDYGVFNNNGIAIGDMNLASGTGQGITGNGPYSPLQILGTNQGWASSMIEMGCVFPTALKDLINSVNENAVVRIKGGWGNTNTDNLAASTLTIEPTINISGGSGTIIRGVYYNPTVTNTNNGIHIGFQNTKGSNLFNSVAGNTIIGATADNGINKFQVQGGTSYFGDNVGIGITTPSQKLEVAGSIKVTGLILPTAAGAGKVLTSDVNGNATWQTATGSSSSNWSVSGNNIFNANGGLVVIGALPATLPANDANLKLAVNGNIYAQKLKITQNGWADYVFDPAYKLRTLQEVETFIQKNNHLPEMPSTAEVEKQGIDVGDNQAVLLKKVEELTLYIIDLNKRIEALEKEKKIAGSTKQNVIHRR